MTENEAWGQAFENGRKVGDAEGYARGLKEAVKHGRWVDHCVRDWRCSECGGKLLKVRHIDGYCYDDKPKYCPDCGARMDGDGDG